MPAQGGWIEREPQADQIDEVLIAGGGVIGLACAWRAARARAERLRARASRASPPGRAASPPGCSLRSARRPGARRRCSSWGWPRCGCWDEFAAELEADRGDRPATRRFGALHVALDRDEAEELRRRHELHQRLGLGLGVAAARRAARARAGARPRGRRRPARSRRGRRGPGRPLRRRSRRAVASRAAGSRRAPRSSQPISRTRPAVTLADGRRARAPSGRASRRALGGDRRLAARGAAAAGAPGQGRDPDPARRRGEPVCRADRRRRAGLPGPPRGRPAGRRRHGGGARLRPTTSPPAGCTSCCARPTASSPRWPSWSCCRRGPGSAREPRQRAADRPRRGRAG